MADDATGLLDSIEIETGPTPGTSIIWLHGLGASGDDFAGVVPALGLPPELVIRFIFPHAPQRPVTINNGLVMPAWYDISNALFIDGEDEVGIRASSQAIGNLIRNELDRGIDSRRIILAGFSQGGAIALFCGLRYPQSLGGIIALSTYLPLARQTLDESTAVNQRLRVFLAHGTQDPVVPLTLGEQTRGLLGNHGYPVEWHEYPLEHNVSIEEIHDIGVWIQHKLR